jgi:hypothetical protein
MRLSRVSVTDIYEANPAPRQAVITAEPLAYQEHADESVKQDDGEPFSQGELKL